MDFLSHKYRMIFIHFLGKFEQANVPKVLGKVCPIISVQDMDLYWLGLRDYLSLKWDQLREGCTKKTRKKCGLLPNWGEGGSRRVVKCQTSILEKYFFS